MSAEPLMDLIRRIDENVHKIVFVGPTKSTSTRSAHGRHFMCFSHDGSPRQTLLHDVPRLMDILLGRVSVDRTREQFDRDHERALERAEEAKTGSYEQAYYRGFAAGMRHTRAIDATYKDKDDDESA